MGKLTQEDIVETFAHYYRSMLRQLLEKDVFYGQAEKIGWNRDGSFDMAMENLLTLNWERFSYTSKEFLHLVEMARKRYDQEHPGEMEESEELYCQLVKKQHSDNLTMPLYKLYVLLLTGISCQKKEQTRQRYC